MIIFSFAEDYFKFLSRSFSLPNLTFTPLESLLPTADELLEAAIGMFLSYIFSFFFHNHFFSDYSDDFEPVSPIKQIRALTDDNEVWHMEQTLVPGDPTQNSDIFAYLESQRAMLEQKVGVNTLIKVYKMIGKLEQSEDEKIDYNTLTKVLGKGNEDLIDDIIQLVVADQFFH